MMKRNATAASSTSNGSFLSTILSPTKKKTTGFTNNKSFMERMIRKSTWSPDDDDECCEESSSTNGSSSIHSSSTGVPLPTETPRRIVPIYPKRSCWKGSKKHGNNSMEKQRDARRVRIPEEPSQQEQIQIVQSYLRYSSDIWWTTKQLDQMLKGLLDYSQINDTRSCRAMEKYLKSYYSLRHQLEQADHMTSCGFLSKRTYHKLVKGCRNGLHGIERHVGIDVEFRKNHVDRVVAYYQRQKSFDGNSNSNSNSDFNHEAVACYSHSSSAKDRCWAYIIGTAQHLAAYDDDYLKGESKIQIS